MEDRKKYKPYQAYKSSGVEWIGEIPEGWEVRKLKRQFRIINGATPSSGIESYWDGDIIWITPDDIGKLSSIYITNSARKITKKGYESCGTTLTPPDSIIISTRAPIGYLGLSKAPTCTNQGCRTLV
jgi:type I restriction enzyme, S subunit